MAIPGHEFVRAYFSNNERTTVESFWTDGKVERVEYIEAKDGDPNWENLLTHINIDDLHEATYKHIREQNDVFEDSVLKIAKERGMIHDLNEMRNQNIHKLIKDRLYLDHMTDVPDLDVWRAMVSLPSDMFFFFCYLMYIFLIVFMN